MTDTEKLKAFARWCIEQSREAADLDCYDLHDKAVELGLLIEDRVYDHEKDGGHEYAEEGDILYMFGPILTAKQEDG